MQHFLNLNIAIHELENGKIVVNPRMYPPAPPPLSEELQNNEIAKITRDVAIQMREEFIAAQ